MVDIIALIMFERIEMVFIHVYNNLGNILHILQIDSGGMGTQNPIFGYYPDSAKNGLKAN